MRAFVVLGGDGWNLPRLPHSGKLAEHPIHAALIRCDPGSVHQAHNNGHL
jgi:hypothetical protein